MYLSEKMPKQRLHTLGFLSLAAKHASVYLHTDIDVSKIVLMKQSSNYSYMAYLISIISEVILKFKRANSYCKTGFVNKIISYDFASAKFTLDKNFNGERVVVSGVIHNSDSKSISEIQSCINLYKHADVAKSSVFSGIRLIDRIPFGIGKCLMSLVMRNPKLSPKAQGTFSISSLGHCDISAFFPITTTTLGFGVAQVKSVPVCVKDKIVIKPMLPLSLVFDHRVIDGAMAAEILAAIKHKIENLIGDNHV